ncbi:MAG: YdbL family protein [Halioglobus sp.]
MQFQTVLKKAVSVMSLSFILMLPAYALDLSEAKSTGQVGETTTGYIAAIKPSTKVTALVADINSQRKVYYQEIANQNSISLQAVEARAGIKAIEKTPPGEFVNSGAGWQLK